MVRVLTSKIQMIYLSDIHTVTIHLYLELIGQPVPKAIHLQEVAVLAFGGHLIVFTNSL